MYLKIIKPIIDLFLASIALLLLLPVFVLITFLLTFTNKGTPFFVQRRPGKKKQLFKIIKFKTMTDKVDENGNLLPDSLRITIVGNFIRKSSLDEIPQLINVIKGDMSLIGPRPLLPEYLVLYNDFQKRRHEVKPGITGWAQVNGRNAISWNQKFEYDVYYVTNISFDLDVKIFFKTIKKVFLRSDINKAKEATMSRFKGNNHE